MCERDRARCLSGSSDNGEGAKSRVSRLKRGRIVSAEDLQRRMAAQQPSETAIRPAKVAHGRSLW
jgi:hypothetical protein